MSGGRGGREEDTAAEGGEVAEDGAGCVAGECERRPTTTGSRGRALLTPATRRLVRRTQQKFKRKDAPRPCQSVSRKARQPLWVERFHSCKPPGLCVGGCAALVAAGWGVERI